MRNSYIGMFKQNKTENCFLMTHIFNLDTLWNKDILVVFIIKKILNLARNILKLSLHYFLTLIESNLFLYVNQRIWLIFDNIVRRIRRRIATINLNCDRLLSAIIFQKEPESECDNELGLLSAIYDNIAREGWQPGAWTMMHFYM